jgi:hypothetical protein
MAGTSPAMTYKVLDSVSRELAEKLIIDLWQHKRAPGHAS